MNLYISLSSLSIICSATGNFEAKYVNCDIRSVLTIKTLGEKKKLSVQGARPTHFWTTWRFFFLSEFFSHASLPIYLSGSIFLPVNLGTSFDRLYAWMKEHALSFLTAAKRLISKKLETFLNKWKHSVNWNLSLAYLHFDDSSYCTLNWFLPFVIAAKGGSWRSQTNECCHILKQKKTADCVN